MSADSPKEPMHPQVGALLSMEYAQSLLEHTWSSRSRLLHWRKSRYLSPCVYRQRPLLAVYLAFLFSLGMGVFVTVVIIRLALESSNDLVLAAFGSFVSMAIFTFAWKTVKESLGLSVTEYPDRIVYRRFWRRKEIPFREITDFDIAFSDTHRRTPFVPLGNITLTVTNDPRGLPGKGADNRSRVTLYGRPSQRRAVTFSVPLRSFTCPLLSMHYMLFRAQCDPPEVVELNLPCYIPDGFIHLTPELIDGVRALTRATWPDHRRVRPRETSLEKGLRAAYAPRDELCEQIPAEPLSRGRGTEAVARQVFASTWAKRDLFFGPLKGQEKDAGVFPQIAPVSLWFLTLIGGAALVWLSIEVLPHTLRFQSPSNIEFLILMSAVSLAICALSFPRTFGASVTEYPDRIEVRRFFRTQTLAYADIAAVSCLDHWPGMYPMSLVVTDMPSGRGRITPEDRVAARWAPVSRSGRPTTIRLRARQCRYPLTAMYTLLFVARTRTPVEFRAFLLRTRRGGIHYTQEVLTAAILANAQRWEIDPEVLCHAVNEPRTPMDSYALIRACQKKGIGVDTPPLKNEDRSGKWTAR